MRYIVYCSLFWVVPIRAQITQSIILSVLLASHESCIFNIHCVSIKISLFYFCDNFPNCKSIPIIFGRNITEKIWNKLMYDNFDPYLLRVADKMMPIFVTNSIT